MGYYLAALLIDLKIKVRIVENNQELCQQLSELLPEATVICGDVTDKKLLLQEGLTQTESFITLTNIDEENIFLSLFAKKNSKAKLITKVNRIAFDDIIDGLDIGSVIYPKYITADYILQYVRAMENSLSSNVETLYHILDNQAEALEFSVKEASSVTDIPLSQLNLKENLLIACINRNGSIQIPRGQDTIQVGDTVITVSYTHLLYQHTFRKPKIRICNIGNTMLIQYIKITGKDIAIGFQNILHGASSVSYTHLFLA